MGKLRTISRLEVRMYQRFLLIAIGISLANAAVQYRFEYQKAIAKHEQELIEIKNDEISGLANNIWNPNPVYIRNFVNDTLHDRKLTFVQVLRDDGEEIAEAGTKLDANFIQGTYPIYYEMSGERISLGALVMQFDKAAIRDDLRSLPVISLIGSTIKSLVILTLIFLVLRRFVTRRISKVSHYFDNFDPDSMAEETGLTLRNPNSKSPDEIDNLILGVNRMHRVILAKMAIIKDTANKLREKVDSTEWELHKAHDQKANLLRALSHDITNPLTIILGNIVVLEAALNKGTVINEKKLRKIKWAANSIKEMIDHVRTADAIASGKIKLDLEPINLGDIMETARLMFEERLEQKNIKLIYDADKMAQIYVRAHYSSLSNQVINNLISNAIKFSHDGDKLSVEAWEDGDAIKVTITDQGIGMPADMVKVLFDGDSSVSRQGTNGEKGTGFGMLLIKSSMVHFGGDIEVDSRCMHDTPDDHGTTFTLTFVKAAAPEAIDMDKAAA